MIILVTFAFIAGFVTILSPCILPVLPIILAASVAEGRRRPIGVILGFILSFTFFTLALATLVKLLGLSPDFLRNLAVVVIFSFGLTMAIPSLNALWEKWTSGLISRQKQSGSKSGFFGGLALGISLGLIWAPCVGPILASVITLAASSTVTSATLLITFAYALGTAIPLSLILFGGRWLVRVLPIIKRHSLEIQRVFGVLMILVAFMIAFSWDRRFQAMVLEFFPQYGANLTSLEDNPQVNQQLDRLSQQPTPKNSKTAPGFTGGTNWLNSQPLTLESLKGKVVLVDFWTYTCVNCLRTLPYLRAWHQRYANQGLVIIGVHTPEFAFEKDSQNVSQALKDLGITYPVVQDNDYAIWKAYRNRYWPAKYLLDQSGTIRYTHFGEGKYEETEAKIRELLQEVGTPLTNTSPLDPPPPNQAKTPETYLGYDRQDNFSSPQGVKRDQIAQYSIPSTLKPNHWALSGSWLIASESALAQPGSSLVLDFDAREVNLVFKPVSSPVKVIITLDNDPSTTRELSLTQNQLYNLVNLDTGGRHTLRLDFPDGGVEAYAFTFG